MSAEMTAEYSSSFNFQTGLLRVDFVSSSSVSPDYLSSFKYAFPVFVPLSPGHFLFPFLQSLPGG
jgi:hypothetical protein